ncbi:MAG: methyltransferase [Desulfosporosinus sp. BRH_c37]|nr:MAG: methyltransferase [Desulfosporosinus sp. BRH_c37]
MEMNILEFDKVAREVFAPIYPVIAEQIKLKTGITRGKCLDLGCGGGYLSIALARITGLNIHLLDVSQEMLDIAASNIAENGLEARMQTLLADVQEIPLKDKSVDLIISRGSIFFWEDQQKAFEEIYRVLTPGGVAYIGGGFGTVELKKQIFAEMEKRDKNWNEESRKRIGKHAIENFREKLQNAKIEVFELNRDDTGLWIVIR